MLLHLRVRCCLYLCVLLDDAQVFVNLLGCAVSEFKLLADTLPDATANTNNADNCAKAGISGSLSVKVGQQQSVYFNSHLVVNSAHQRCLYSHMQLTVLVPYLM